MKSLFAALALASWFVFTVVAQEAPGVKVRYQAVVSIDGVEHKPVSSWPLAAGQRLEPVQLKDKKPAKFKTGAKKTPMAKVIEAIRLGRLNVHRQSQTTPSQVAMVPAKLSFWGNDVDGDCVSAESAGAMAAYSTYLGLPEIFIPDATLIAWATSHGFLNGADLLSVIQAMQTDGIVDDTGVLRKEGTPSVVDYTTEAVLQNAISVGPVSIAIDSTALPSTAGNANGWYAFGGTPEQFANTDHCVGLWGYGPTKFLSDSLGVAVPPGSGPTSYLLFTWDTIGIVDYAWVMSTCSQAFVRTPTVTGLTPTPPPPPPPPTPTPTTNLNIPNLTPDQVAAIKQQFNVSPVNPPGSVVLSPATVQALLRDLSTAAQKAKK